MLDARINIQNDLKEGEIINQHKNIKSNKCKGLIFTLKINYTSTGLSSLRQIMS